MLNITKKLSAVFAAVMMTAALATSANAVTVDADMEDQLVTESTASVKAVSLPLADYPDGSYYSRYGTECTCHGKTLGNPCEYYIPCDCKVFDASIQCVAFAKDVYYRYHGKLYSPSNKVVVDKSLSSGSIAKSYLKGKPEGTYVAGRCNATTHIIIIVATSENGITFYHANGYRDYPCQVRYQTLTWDKFADYFTYLTHYAI